MSDEIKIIEDENEDLNRVKNKRKDVSENGKIRIFFVIAIIILIAIFATFLVAFSGESKELENNKVEQIEPTSMDSKLQAKILKEEKKTKREKIKYIKDNYYTNLNSNILTRGERIVNQLKEKTKNTKDKKKTEKKEDLYDVLNVKDLNKDEIGKIKNELTKKENIVKQNRKYIRKPKPAKKRLIRRINRNTTVFAKEINGNDSGILRNLIEGHELGKYGNQGSEEMLDKKMGQIKKLLSQYMNGRDYSVKMNRGGEISVIYNKNPVVNIYEGDFLECVLKNRIKSDIAESPAIVVVGKDFFDDSGKYVAIPKGTRVIGYSKAVNYKGANRLFIFFKRMILPNGISINLNNKSIALNKYGENGVSSGVNRHFFLKYGSSFLVGLLDGLGGLTQNKLSQSSSMSYMIQEVFRNLRGTSNNYIDEYKDIVPTIRVNEGTKILVYLSSDIKISAYSKISDMSYAKDLNYTEENDGDN